MYALLQDDERPQRNEQNIDKTAGEPRSQLVVRHEVLQYASIPAAQASKRDDRTWW